MSPSSVELLRQVKSSVEEVDPGAVHEMLGAQVNGNSSNGKSNGTPVLIDVRETEEFTTGHIPGAKHVPRGYLQSRIEGVVPDRGTPVVLYCASGNRSAYATRTLTEDLG